MAGAEPSGQMRDEKLHAVVARSKFRSQHVKSTSCSQQFGALRCSTSARRCGAKHTSKSNVQKRKQTGTDHFLTFSCRFEWHAQGIVHLVNSEQNMRVSRHF